MGCAARGKKRGNQERGAHDFGGREEVTWSVHVTCAFVATWQGASLFARSHYFLAGTHHLRPDYVVNAYDFQTGSAPRCAKDRKRAIKVCLVKLEKATLSLRLATTVQQPHKVDQFRRTRESRTWET